MEKNLHLLSLSKCSELFSTYITKKLHTETSSQKILCWCLVTLLKCAILDGQDSSILTWKKPSVVPSTMCHHKWKIRVNTHWRSIFGVWACWHSSSCVDMHLSRTRSQTGNVKAEISIRHGTGTSFIHLRFRASPKALCEIYLRRTHNKEPT